MKGILKNWHRYLLWLTVSFFFWAWIFVLITDAPAAKKLVLYADLPAMERDALSSELEKNMPEGIRFVEARVFMDEMFSPSNISSGDLFILSGSKAQDYADTFASVGEIGFPGLPLCEIGGRTCGVCVYDEETGIHIGTEYLAYIPGDKYYLFFNVESKHLGELNGSPDDAAIQAARAFLALP